VEKKIVWSKSMWGRNDSKFDRDAMIYWQGSRTSRANPRNINSERRATSMFGWNWQGRKRSDQNAQNSPPRLNCRTQRNCNIDNKHFTKLFQSTPIDRRHCASYNGRFARLAQLSPLRLASTLRRAYRPIRTHWLRIRSNIVFLLRMINVFISFSLCLHDRTNILLMVEK